MTLAGLVLAEFPLEEVLSLAGTQLIAQQYDGRGLLPGRRFGGRCCSAMRVGRAWWWWRRLGAGSDRRRAASPFLLLELFLLRSVGFCLLQLPFFGSRKAFVRLGGSTGNGLRGRLL